MAAAKKPKDGTTPGGIKPGTNMKGSAKAVPTGPDFSGTHYLNKVQNGTIIQVRLGGGAAAKSRVKDDRGPQLARAKNQSKSKKR